MLQSAQNKRSSQGPPRLPVWILVAGSIGLSAFQAPRTAWSVPAQQPVAEAQQTGTSQPASSVETLHVLSGRSLVITSPARIKRVSVADPAVLDAIAVNPNQLLLNGKAPGAASLVIWDETGQSQTFDAYVDLDVTALKSQIRQVLPGEPIAVDAQGGVVTLSGRASS